jgi:YegS/Rv2252/BmrU family lipid kinase
MGPMLDACAILSEAGYLLSVRKTAGNGDAVRIAREEGSDYDLVVAVGGDGTLNETANGLLALENPPLLGYLAQGSTNDFAASLRIADNPAAAASAMVRGTPRQLDVGDWNERKFLYVASFGAFTRSSYSAPQAAKNALGHFAYILEGMKDLNSLRPYNIRLTADGEVLDGEYLFGAVCNSTSLGGLMKLDPSRVVLDDGKFEMLLIPSPKTPTDLQNLVLALLNQEYDREGLVFRHVSSIRVETEEILPWSLDGEFAPSAPVVTITNHQQALTVLL